MENDSIRVVSVRGTGATPYLFGAGDRRRAVHLQDFFIATTPVTQELWTQVMGSNPAKNPGPGHPVENVSWHHITGAGGFLERINGSDILAAVSEGDSSLRFRLPTEVEWEYAARGGPHWRDDYQFSGSNNPNDVAWYGPRWTKAHELVSRVLGPRRGWRIVGRYGGKYKPTHTHPVATKKPNQLGLYDMSGNVWEWCDDERDDEPGNRCLRGGCHDNWDLFCRVWWRYGIEPDAHDGCIGFRLALAPDA